MKPSIMLKSEHRAIVLTILRQHLPDNAQIWVFGSRATGKAHPHSDLDLAIDCGQKLSAKIESALHFAFEDSDLPMTVDIVDMQQISGIFRQDVERDRETLDWCIPCEASAKHD